MASVSVISVTFNNAAGLKSTLQSLSLLREKPLEIIVIDGGSTDETPDVVALYQGELPIRYFSEPDKGIYDGMNKGKKLVRGDWVHYLNAGDFVYGEPYKDLNRACLLPVKLMDENGGIIGMGRVGIFGVGYCHQGIIFPKNHPDYDLSFRIAADFDLVTKVFPGGLHKLPLNEAGGVVYNLCGVSSKKRAARDAEICRSLFQRRRFFALTAFAITAGLKLLLPKTVRRAARRALSGHGS